MNYWILPSNEEVFRLSDYFKTNLVVDWKQNNNFEVGDIVFIYTSKPSRRITYQLSVERVNVRSAEYVNDKRFWVSVEEYQKGLAKNRFVRFQYKAIAPKNCRLSYYDLKANGLTGKLQGATRITDSPLLSYIENQISLETNEK